MGQSFVDGVYETPPFVDTVVYETPEDQHVADLQGIS